MAGPKVWPNKSDWWANVKALKQTESQKILAETGITAALDDKRKKLVVRATLNQVARLYKALPTLKLTDANQGNLDYLLEDNSERIDFAKGTRKELENHLSGQIDLTRYKAPLAELESKGMLRKLRREIERVAPKRRLKLHDTDGDWSYDKRFDDKPFVHLTKTPSRVKTLEIRCHFSVAWHVDAESINKFGALVWAVCQVVEAAGFQARIVYHFQTNSLINQNGYGGDVQVELKKSGSYIAPSFLASAFQALFHRRAAFSLQTVAADACSKAISSGQGLVVSAPKPIQFSEGVLDIGLDAVKGATDEIVEAILGAFSS